MQLFAIYCVQQTMLAAIEATGYTGIFSLSRLCVHVLVNHTRYIASVYVWCNIFVTDLYVCIFLVFGSTCCDFAPTAKRFGLKQPLPLM